MGALAQAVPDRIVAPSHGTFLNLTAGGYDPRTDTDFVFYLYREGGWGGRLAADGNSAVFGTWSNDRQSSMEANEQVYAIRFEAHALTEDSDGAGRSRGGLGTTMRIRVLCPSLRLSLVGERCRSAPFGMFGGLPPEPLAVTLADGHCSERCRSLADAGYVSPTHPAAALAPSPTAVEAARVRRG